MNFLALCTTRSNTDKLFVNLRLKGWGYSVEFSATNWTLTEAIALAELVLLVALIFSFASMVFWVTSRGKSEGFTNHRGLCNQICNTWKETTVSPRDRISAGLSFVGTCLTGNLDLCTSCARFAMNTSFCLSGLRTWAKQMLLSDHNVVDLKRCSFPSVQARRQATARATISSLVVSFFLSGGTLILDVRRWLSLLT